MSIHVRELQAVFVGRRAEPRSFAEASNGGIFTSDTDHLTYPVLISEYSVHPVSTRLWSVSAGGVVPPWPWRVAGCSHGTGADLRSGRVLGTC